MQTSEKTTGKFITVEGIEGAGKSTNVTFIANQLINKGIDVVLTREPGGTKVAEQIRNILLADHDEKIHADTELLLMYAGRIQHYNNLIKPALLAGKWVISDRFYDATFAYQGGGRKIPLERIQTIHDWSMGTIKPDNTIYLDVPVEVGFSRIVKRGELDRFEKEKKQFFEDIRQQYLSIADSEPNRFEIVDASLSLAQIEQILIKLCDKIIAN